MDYKISYIFYKELLTAIRKDKKNAGKRDVIEYLNRTTGILGGIKKLTIG